MRPQRHLASGALAGLIVLAGVVAWANPGLPDDIDGTKGRDRLVGTPNGERLLGYAGDDILIGNGGPDIGIGGTGDDVLRMGAGKDTLNGGSGRNTLHGGLGNDFFLASDGRFEVQLGGPGNDHLNSYGRARLVGGPGRDAAYGGPGVAHIVMGDGPDSITLERDRQPDFVDCGPGQDSLHYIGVPPRNDVVESCEILSYQRASN